MKNLKLIYLIPALMVLVWGCGQGQKPKAETVETTTEESVALVPYCPSVTLADAKHLYNQAGDKSVDLSISPLSNTQRLPNITPLLTSHENGTGHLNMQVMFGISDYQPRSAKLKYFAAEKLMVIAIDVIEGDKDQDFYINGQSSMFSPSYIYQTGDVYAVVAVLRYPDDTTNEYIFSVNQLNQCMDIEPTAEGNSLTLFHVSNYDNYLSRFGEPYIFGRHDSNHSINYVDIAVPINKNFILDEFTYAVDQDSNGNKKITITATEKSNNENLNLQLYHFSGNIKSILGVSGNLIEVEVIIHLVTGGSKKVKIVTQSTDKPLVDGANEFKFRNDERINYIDN